MNALETRNKIMAVEEMIRTAPHLEGDAFPIKHSYADGMYVREISVPKGYLISTKIHKKAHPCFVLKGKCLVLSEEGTKVVAAPYTMITPAGTKRIIFVVEDTVWTTVHKTEERDLELIENEVIAKSFDEIETELNDVQVLKELI